MNNLLQQAKQLEREFEQRKKEYQDLQVQQEVAKRQFAQKKDLLAAKGITFNNGKELQEIYAERQNRLRELIENQKQVMAQIQSIQQNIQSDATIQQPMQVSNTQPMTPPIQSMTQPITQQSINQQTTQSLMPSNNDLLTDINSQAIINSLPLNNL